MWDMKDERGKERDGGEEEQEGEQDSLHTPSVHQRCGSAGLPSRCTSV